MPKKELIILYGGEGGEHEVSIRSAENAIKNIDTNKYSVKRIFLTKKNKWI